MATTEPYTTSVVRYYIDTRKLGPQDPKETFDLPLISTLHTGQQEAIKRYMRLPDRLMSLGSALLKNLFIHRYAKIPWTQVEISRTPDPHKRPYWDPPTSWTEKGGLEFNVTHQAGMVALMGCTTPTVQSSSSSPIHMPNKDNNNNNNNVPVPETASQQVRLGIDIACCNEDRRTPKNVNTQASLDKWIDIFSAMFSERERRDMKYAPIINDSSSSLQDENSTATASIVIIQKKLRRFYTYWALKEAYIKMVGEGLLADWLTELEFTNVIAPDPITASSSSSADAFDSGDDGAHKWTIPSQAEKTTQILFRGHPIQDVRIELVAFEEDFLVASAMRGFSEQQRGDLKHDDVERRWISIDIEKDVRPCAEGRCTCLDA